VRLDPEGSVRGPGSGPEVLLDEYRGFGLADPAPRAAQHQIFDFSRVGVEPARVQTEKGEKDHEPDALVPVYKRASAAIASSHRELDRR
jgi:hypothetical protein